MIVKTGNRGRAPKARRTSLPAASVALVTVLAALAMVLAACGGGRQAPRPVSYFGLEYDAPRFEKRAPSAEVLRVNRFTEPQVLNSTAMVFRGGAGTVQSYPDARWRVNPADLVTDALVRDLGHSGLFKAVFSEYDDAAARFVLQGRVEECLAAAEGGGRQAVLALTLALLDRSERDPVRGVVFQKAYREVVPMDSPTAAAMARAMGQAMEKLSRKMTSDIYEAVKNPGR